MAREIKLLDTFHQAIVVPELLERTNGTRNLVLADETSMPMNGCIHVLAVSLNMDDNAIDQTANDLLSIRRRGVQRLPKRRDVLRKSSDWWIS